MFIAIKNTFDDKIELINISECWLIAPAPTDGGGGTIFFRHGGKEVHAWDDFDSVMQKVKNMQDGRL